MTEKTISAEQVAILAERVDQQNLNHAKLEGMLVGIATSQNEVAKQMAVFGEQMRRFEENKARLFNLADEHHKRLDRIERDVHVHSWTWKLLGSLATVALCVGGWTFNQIQGLHDSDNHRDKRLTLLEFIVGGRDYPPQQSQNIELPKK